MSVDVFLALVLAAFAAGMVALAAGGYAVQQRTGKPPTGRQTATITVVAAALVLVVVHAAWPDPPVRPILVVPATSAPPDPLAGFDQSELP